jgi:hypothetical protein
VTAQRSVPTYTYVLNILWGSPGPYYRSTFRTALVKRPILKKVSQSGAHPIFFLAREGLACTFVSYKFNLVKRIHHTLPLLVDSFK